VSAGRAWAVAALLWVLAAGALYVAHRKVMASFSVFSLAAEAAFGGDDAVADPWAEGDPVSFPEMRDPLLGAEPIDAGEEVEDPWIGPDLEGEDGYSVEDPTLDTGDEAD